MTVAQAGNFSNRPVIQCIGNNTVDIFFPKKWWKFGNRSELQLPKMTKKIVLDSFPRHLKLCLRRSCNSSHGIATRQQCSGCWVWQHTLHIKHRKTHIYQAHQTLKGANLVVDPFFHSADHFLWYCMLKTDFNLFISPSIIDTSSKNFLKWESDVSLSESKNRERVLWTGGSQVQVSTSGTPQDEAIVASVHTLNYYFCTQHSKSLALCT